jgi:hypothetical protein
MRRIAEKLVECARFASGRKAALGCGRWPSGITGDRTSTHGYEATREAAMAAFAKISVAAEVAHDNASPAVIMRVRVYPVFLAYFFGTLSEFF